MNRKVASKADHLLAFPGFLECMHTWDIYKMGVFRYAGMPSWDTNKMGVFRFGQAGKQLILSMNSPKERLEQVPGQNEN